MMNRRSWALFLLAAILASGAACSVYTEVGPGVGPGNDGGPPATDTDAGADVPETGTDADVPETGTDPGCGDADLTSDGANCGKCGHSCLGGVCFAGRCMPVTLAENQTKAFRIAVDSQNVYWTTNVTGGTVGFVPIDGGEAGTLATGMPAPRDLKTDGQFVYFHCSSGTGGVFKVSTTGGAVTQLAVTNAGLNSLAINQDSVFYTYFSSSKVGAVRFDGTNARDLVTQMNGSSSPKGIAADSNNVYFATNGGSKEAQYAPVDGSLSPGAKVLGPDSTIALTSDDKHVFWVGTGGKLYQADKDGANLLTLATLNGANTLASDGTDLYVAVQSAGEIWAVPVGGGEARFIGGGFNVPEGIAVDSKAIYIAEWTGNKITKLAK